MFGVKQFNCEVMEYGKIWVLMVVLIVSVVDMFINVVEKFLVIQVKVIVGYLVEVGVIGKMIGEQEKFKILMQVDVIVKLQNVVVIEVLCVKIEVVGDVVVMVVMKVVGVQVIVQVMNLVQ